MMTPKLTLVTLALATLAACSQSPIEAIPVQQLDSTTVWSTGNYR
ncbi:hypothetical protein [Oceanicola sp. 502str15]|nr:hypothetical protein [Oceanicola sp. 502str15]